MLFSIHLKTEKLKLAAITSVHHTHILRSAHREPSAYSMTVIPCAMGSARRYTSLSRPQLA